MCVKDDYKQPLGPRDENMMKKLKKPTKTQRLKPSKEKQNIPIHRLNRKAKEIRRCSCLEGWKLEIHSPVEPTMKILNTSVQWQKKTKENAYIG